MTAWNRLANRYGITTTKEFVVGFFTSLDNEEWFYFLVSVVLWPTLIGWFFYAYWSA